MSKRLALALCLWLLSAGAARAGLPFSYDVDAKTFTKTIPAGSPLSFGFYTTPDCTGPAFLLDDLEVGTEFQVEEARPLAAKGQKPKPKRIARFSGELDVVPPASRLYLIVTGASGALAGCQAQAHAPARPTSPLWISAYEFDGVSSASPWIHGNDGEVTHFGTGACLHAPIRLPDGTVLDRFEAYVRDEVPGGAIEVWIFRTPLEAGVRTELAHDASIDQAGTQVLMGPVATEPVVDNTQFHYFVQLCVGGAGFTGGEHGAWAVAVFFE